LTEGEPSGSDVRHVGYVTQQGKVGDDVVVYSSFLGTDVGSWFFNWVGLYSVEYGVLIAATYVARQQKIASVGSTMGNSLTKNFAVQYTGLASLANVTIDAETWQLDLTGQIATAVAAAKTIGEVVSWPTSTVPDGFLECDGAEISRTTFAELFAVIGTAFGVGDGATTFELPDLRGEFVRGWDHGRGVDSARAIGSNQSDEFASHTHSVSEGSSLPGTGNDLTSGDDYTNIVAKYADTTAAGGTETRPRNVALMYCIRYA
jgi:microcystin-dependent protein